MFEKEIEVLSGCWNRRTEAINEAIWKAIALMRAAEPSDEAAEREHCSKKAREFGYSEAWIEIRAREMMEQRAAARAGVRVAAEAELCIVRKDRDDWKERALKAQSEAELGASSLRMLQAENERLRAASVPSHDETAEREYCLKTAKDTVPWAEAYAERVERERAAARAEGYAAGHAIARDSILELSRLRSALTNACNALRVYDGQGGTAEVVVTELLAVLKRSSQRPALGQALDEFVQDVADAVKRKGHK